MDSRVRAGRAGLASECIITHKHGTAKVCWTVLKVCHFLADTGNGAQNAADGEGDVEDLGIVSEPLSYIQIRTCHCDNHEAIVPPKGLDNL